MNKKDRRLELVKAGIDNVDSMSNREVKRYYNNLYNNIIENFKDDIGYFEYCGLAFKFSKIHQWRNEKRDPDGKKQLFFIKLGEEEPLIFKGVVSSSSKAYYSVKITDKELMIINEKVSNYRIVNDLSEIYHHFVLFARVD